MRELEDEFETISLQDKAILQELEKLNLELADIETDIPVKEAELEKQENEIQKLETSRDELPDSTIAEKQLEELTELLSKLQSETETLQFWM